MNPRLIAAAAGSIMLPLLGACHDTTGPEAPFSVSVTIESSTGPTFIDTDTIPIIQCEVVLRAVAQGDGSAVWADGEFYIFLGADRATPVDSSVMPAAEVRGSWGASAIDAKLERHAQWRISSSIPFGVAFVYSYIKNGVTRRTDPVEFTCGPTIPPSVAPPTLSSAGADPAGGELDSGDTLKIGFSASSPVGVWESEIEFSGACTLSQHFYEHLSITVAHNVPVVIPPNCLLGGALHVSVRAYDASARGAQASLGPFTIVDRKPPQVSASFGANTSPTMGWHVFAGDTVGLGIGAADNRALSAAFWEFLPQGQRDSIPMFGPSWSQSTTVPIQSSWTGVLRLRVWARDSAGNTSDTLLVPAADSIRIIPLVTHPLRTSVTVPNLRTMTLVDPRRMVYAVPWNSRQVLGVSMQSALITDTIVLPSNGGDIDATASGDTLVVVLPAQRAIGIVDLTVSPRTVTVVPLSTIAGDSVYPDRLRVMANDEAFLTLSGTFGSVPSQLVLLDVNLHAGTDRVRTDAGVSGVVGDAALERSLDHTMLLVEGGYGLQRYASVTDAFSPGRILDTQLFGAKIDGAGSRIVMGTSLYDGAFNFEREFESPSSGPVPAVLSPDGQTLYQAVWPQGIMRNEAGTGRLLERTKIPFQTLDIRMSGDGTMLIMYDSQFSRIAVMDLQ